MREFYAHKDPLKAGRGFSLVEVILALGLASFALIALIGLLSVAFRSSRDTAEETRVVSILETMVADRMVSPQGTNSTMYGIPPLSAESSSTIYIREDGSVGSQASDARFRIDIRAHPAAGQGRPGYMHFQATWPPGAAPSAASRLEILASFPNE